MALERNTSICQLVLNDFTNDSRVLKESRTLSNQGYQVTVIALHGPGLDVESVVQGVHVKRIRLVSRRLPKWRPLQFVKYAEFILRFMISHTRFDIIHCNDLNALLVGVAAKSLPWKKIKIVYDAHEHESERNGFSRFERRASRLLEKALLPSADKVITVSASIADDYVRIYGIKRPTLVLNCPYRQAPPKTDYLRKELGIPIETQILLYQGSLSKGRGVEGLMESFSSLITPNIALVFMGYGPLTGMIKLKSVNTNIFHYPAVPPHVLLDYTSSADIGLCLIEDTCLSYKYCLPNKMFEYMMAGLPVVGLNLVEIAKVIENCGIGVTMSKNTTEELNRAISEINAMPQHTLSKNLLKASEKYCWEVQEIELQALYSELCAL